MKKNKLVKTLIILGPPIALVLIGIGVYIAVIKILTPDLKTISAIPNTPPATSSASQSTPTASPSAISSNPISTVVITPSDTDLTQWQTEADQGKELWRIDPVSAAEHFAGSYGFIPGDQLTLVTSQDPNQVPSKSIEIVATHNNQAYVLTMVQPRTVGIKGIWIIKSIEKQA